MFRSRGLAMEGDHVDVSFRRPEEWPPMPWKSIQGVMFRMGDAERGPSVNLAAFTPHDDEPLDWDHTIDPMHFHGSDQFRLEVNGTWVTTRQPFTSGGYLYQEAGRVYQEHPADGECSWLVLVYGDKRGEAATLTLKADRVGLLEGGVTESGGEPLAAGEYRHPAGPKGVSAIASTVGRVERGYLWGSFEDAAQWHPLSPSVTSAAGVFGDVEAGPLVCLLHSNGGGPVIPPSSYDTELFLIVSRGSCEIGGVTYVVGDMRVQAAGTVLPPVITGPDGADLTFIFGDRRGVAGHATFDPGSTWWRSHLSDVHARLTKALVTA